MPAQEQQFSCAFTDLFEIVEEQPAAKPQLSEEDLTKALPSYFEVNA